MYRMSASSCTFALGPKVIRDAPCGALWQALTQCMASVVLYSTLHASERKGELKIASCYWIKIKI